MLFKDVYFPKTMFLSRNMPVYKILSCGFAVCSKRVIKYSIVWSFVFWLNNERANYCFGSIKLASISRAWNVGYKQVVEHPCSLQYLLIRSTLCFKCVYV